MLGLDLIPKEKILNFFASKYLEKDDKSILAWYDENGEIKHKIFKFDFLAMVQKDIKKLSDRIIEQEKEINDLKSKLK